MSKPTWITPERNALVKQVVSTYQNDWRRAMTEHPDWRRTLDYDSPKGKKNCHNTASRYRQYEQPSGLTNRPNNRYNMLNTFWTPERDDLVQRLLREYNADYAKAFAEHPDWKLKLLPVDDGTYRGRLYARISAARRGTITRFGLRHSTKDASAGLDDNLIQRIIADYVAVDGRLSLSQAFADHPDWKKELKADDVLGQRRVYGRIKTLRDRAAKAELKAATNGAPEANGLEAAPAPPQPQAPDLSDVLHQCPQCGFDLDTFRRAFRTAFNTAFNIAKRRAQ